ncbi:MAG: hypothetical protein ABJB66_04215 [Gemmatimonadaceae bacterium]
MTSMRKFIVTAVAASVLGVSLAGAQSPAPAKQTDISGKWAFTVQTENGPGTPSVTFKQEADKITGTYVSQLLGTAPLAGTVKEKNIEFVVKADVQGQAVEVTFKGTIEADDSMKGSIAIAGMGGGTFTAKRAT